MIREVCSCSFFKESHVRDVSEYHKDSERDALKELRGQYKPSKLSRGKNLLQSDVLHKPRLYSSSFRNLQSYDTKTWNIFLCLCKMNRRCLNAQIIKASLIKAGIKKKNGATESILDLI